LERNGEKEQTMYGYEPSITYELLRDLEKEQRVKQLELARLLHEGRADRPTVGDRVAVRAGSALVAIGEWLIERSGAAFARPTSSLG
jgi:hypothetical protein